MKNRIEAVRRAVLVVNFCILLGAEPCVKMRFGCRTRSASARKSKEASGVDSSPDDSRSKKINTQSAPLIPQSSSSNRRLLRRRRKTSQQCTIGQSVSARWTDGWYYSAKIRDINYNSEQVRVQWNDDNTYTWVSFVHVDPTCLGKCEGWCNGHASPWITKCGWTDGDCAGCPMCACAD